MIDKRVNVIFTKDESDEKRESELKFWSSPVRRGIWRTAILLFLSGMCFMATIVCIMMKLMFSSANENVEGDMIVWSIVFAIVGIILAVAPAVLKIIDVNRINNILNELKIIDNTKCIVGFGSNDIIIKNEDGQTSILYDDIVYCHEDKKGIFIRGKKEKILYIPGKYFSEPAALNITKCMKAVSKRFDFYSLVDFE